MTCSAFGKCGSCTLYDTPYRDQLTQKAKKLSEILEVPLEQIEVFPSQESGYRMRAEFQIMHYDDSLFFAMSGFNKKKVPIDSCNIVYPTIGTLIQALPAKLLTPVLRERLFGVEFIANNSGETITTLIYHKKLDSAWKEAASALAEQSNTHIIGRSKGQKIVLSQERLLDMPTPKYRTYIHEGAFFQPNVFANTHMIKWIEKSVLSHTDGIELYCGNGNFTFVLAELFNKLLATEISKTALQDADDAKQLNQTENITFARLSAEELVEALKGKRKFFRLKDIDLNIYDFSTLFVDPPRAGLSENVVAFAKGFQNILHISCNPLTLKRDLDKLDAHKIERIAMFDQFPHTEHIECGVELSRIR